MIDKSFVEKIVEIAATKAVMIDGTEFASRPVFNPPIIAEERPDTIQVSSLSAVRDFCNAFVNPDGTHVLHIVDERTVMLLGPILPISKKREHRLTARVPNKAFGFGHFIEHDQFMIELMSMFDPHYGDVAEILRMMGTVKSEGVRTSIDDGVSQKVTASSGVTLVQELVVKNPVTLQPYRTFLDVTQPPSKFILRLEAEEGELPSAALFEGDGGRWRVEAVDNIATYLREATKGIVVVG